MLTQETFIDTISPSYAGALRSKLPFIDEAIDTILCQDNAIATRLNKKGSIAVDIFAGAGSVSWKLRARGFVVHANDIEYYTSGWLNSAVTFQPDRVKNQLQELYNTTNLLDVLTNVVNDKLEEIDRFKPYSSDTGDNYFSCKNGQILEAYFKEIKHIPKNTCLYHLLMAYTTTLCIKYANSPGTFQKPYKKWGSGQKERANAIRQDITINNIHTMSENKPIGKVHHLDGLALANRFGKNAIDIAFIDPPSDTRQYASYYQLLNTFQENGYTSVASPMSKRTTAKAYMAQLILAWTDKAKWLIINYPDKGIIAIDELIVMLNLCGKNKVTVLQKITSKYRNGKTTTTTQRLLLVQTNTWQSPTDIQNVVREWRKSESKRIKEDSYIDPLKLNAKMFKIETYALGWNIYIKQKLFAKIHHTRKVLSCDNTLLTTAQEKAWSAAVLNPIDLFKLYIAEKKWAKAIKLLRLWRKQKMTNAGMYTQMLYSVLQAQGIKKYAQQIRTWRYEN